MIKPIKKRLIKSLDELDKERRSGSDFLIEEDDGSVKMVPGHELGDVKLSVLSSRLMFEAIHVKEK